MIRNIYALLLVLGFLLITNAAPGKKDQSQSQIASSTAQTTTTPPTALPENPSDPNAGNEIAPNGPVVAPAPQSGSVALNVPPPMPSVWPPPTQDKPLDGAYLDDPLVTDALEYVNSVVPADILAIAPGQFVTGSTVNYDPAAAVERCYWPLNLCVRDTATAYYHADVYACPDANVWGLTYDDGPTYNNGVDDTSDIRSSLKESNLKATFFVAGANTIQYPNELKATNDEGHELAVHTWTHHPLTSLTNAQVVAEIKYTEAQIYNATGRVPNMIRPPYGDVDDRVRAIMWALGYYNILWTTKPNRDTEDTESTPDKIVETVKTWIVPQPGFISLEHDISAQSSQGAVKVLAMVASQLQSGTFPLTIKAIGQCQGMSWHRDGAPVTPVTAAVATPSAIETDRPGGIIPSIGPNRVQSGHAARGIAIGGWWVVGAMVFAMLASERH